MRRIRPILVVLLVLAACSSEQPRPPVQDAQDRPAPRPPPDTELPKTPPTKPPPPTEACEPSAWLRFEPESIDFGRLTPACSEWERRIEVENRCEESIFIESVRVEEDDFLLPDLPRLPVELGPKERMEVFVAFEPLDFGRRVGAIRLDARSPQGENETFLLPLSGELLADVMQTDTFIQPALPQADFLWVVNNSTSMSEKEALLERTLPRLMELATMQGLDLRVGVTTTAIGAGASCEETGYAENEDGRLVPHPSVGKARILDSSMGSEDLLSAFQENVRVGTCHDSTTVLEAARRALSPPWVDTPEEGGGNQGLLRPDASLIIFGVTDREDEARWEGEPTAEPDVSAYVEFFQRLKPARKRDFVKIHMISGGTEGCSGPGGEAEPCPACVQAAESTGGLSLEICKDADDPAWEEAFAPMASMSAALLHFSKDFSLRATPADQNGDGVVDERDFEVRVGGVPVAPFDEDGAKIWRYSFETNRIVFSPLHEPSPNQRIEVTYQVACPF